MAKFEVGDRVKVKAGAGGHGPGSKAWARRGQAGVVAKDARPTEEPRVTWDSDGKESLCYADALERCDKFKPGDRVRWRGSGGATKVGTVEAWTFEFRRGLCGCVDDTQWRDDTGRSLHSSAESLELVTEFKVGDRVRHKFTGKHATLVTWSFPYHQRRKVAIRRGEEITTCLPSDLEPLAEVWRLMAVLDGRLESMFAPNKRAYEQGVECASRCTAFKSEALTRDWAGAMASHCELWRCEAVVTGGPAGEGWPCGTVFCEHLMPLERVACYRDGVEESVSEPVEEPVKEDRAMVKSAFITQDPGGEVHVHLEGEQYGTDSESGVGLRRVCAYFGEPFPDVSEIEAQLRAERESNERLRRAIRKLQGQVAEHVAADPELTARLGDALSSAQASYRRIQEACSATGCGDDTDHATWIRNLHATLDRVRGEASDLRGKLTEATECADGAEAVLLGKLKRARENDETLCKLVESLEATAGSLRTEVEGKANLLGVARSDRDDLRETLAKCSEQRASARERVDHLKSARLADAAVVEAAVAYKRVWDDTLEWMPKDVQAKFHAAVAAHPSFRAAEPAPEPEPRLCGGCGECYPLDEFSHNLCQECRDVRDNLDAIFKGDGDEED